MRSGAYAGQDTSSQSHSFLFNLCGSRFCVRVRQVAVRIRGPCCHRLWLAVVCSALLHNWTRSTRLEDAVSDGPAPNRREWKLHAVGEPSTTNWVNADCCPFEHVVHFTHISQAVRILEDGVIRPTPVEEGRLKGTGTSVIWLSPNVCGESYFGNIGFRFKWSELKKGGNLYWVENPPSANRILISAASELERMETSNSSCSNFPFSLSR